MSLFYRDIVFGFVIFFVVVVFFEMGVNFIIILLLNFYFIVNIDLCFNVFVSREL